MRAARRLATILGGILGGILAILAVPLGAQQPERAVFLVRLGHDTLAVENASFTNGRAEGDLRYTSGDPNGYGKLASYAVRRDFLGVLADWLASTL